MLADIENCFSLMKWGSLITNTNQFLPYKEKKNSNNERVSSLIIIINQSNKDHLFCLNRLVQDSKNGRFYKNDQMDKNWSFNLLKWINYMIWIKYSQTDFRKGLIKNNGVRFEIDGVFNSYGYSEMKNYFFENKKVNTNLSDDPIEQKEWFKVFFDNGPKEYFKKTQHLNLYT